MFAGLFIISYVLGEMISNKLSAFKNVKILKEMSKFIWRNVLLFVVLGAVISGLMDGIFSLWKFLREWCADQNSKNQNESITFPSFDYRASN